MSKPIKKTKKVIQEIIQWGIHLLYPKRCPFCDKVIFYSILYKTLDVCHICADKLEYLEEPVCKICGKPVIHDRMEICYDCENTNHYFKQGKALFVYKGIVKESLYRYKYAGRKSYGDFYGKQIAKRYKRWIMDKKIELIIPIPLHKDRKRQRGFNQAEVLARIIGRELEIPVDASLLVRIKNTKPQKELNDVERKNNLKSAFKIKKNKVQLRHILLVDDIYTTGNTMDIVSKELIKSGADSIYCLCISIGRGYEEEKIWM